MTALAMLVAVAATGGVAAKAAAAAELLMFESPVCPWCARWRAEIGPVYPKTDEGKIAPLRRIDIHRTRAPAYRTIKGIVYTPTFVLWHDGREVGRIVGYSGEDFFWALLGELIDDMRAGRYAKSPSIPSATAPLPASPLPPAANPGR